MPVVEMAHCIMQYRRGRLDVSGWPDCAPGKNDTRLAREFLLFLKNFGLCRKTQRRSRFDERYFSDEAFDADAVANLTDASIFADETQASEVIDAVSKALAAATSAIPAVSVRNTRAPN